MPLAQWDGGGLPGAVKWGVRQPPCVSPLFR